MVINSKWMDNVRTSVTLNIVFTLHTDEETMEVPPESVIITQNTKRYKYNIFVKH